MNLPIAFDAASALGPMVAGGPLLEFTSLVLSALVALLFLAYLFRCYFQEFRHARRVQRRKRLARPGPAQAWVDRKNVVEECRCRRRSVMDPQPDAPLPAVDWRGLHFLIPSHERVTLVWDTGRPWDGAPPTLCIVSETVGDETLTGNGRSPTHAPEH